MKKKHSLKVALICYLSAMAILVIILLFLLFYGNKRFMKEYLPNHIISIYYRDTLDVDSVFPDLVKYDVSISNDKLAKQGRKFYFENPETITIDDINIKIKFTGKHDSLTKIVKVRCWKEDCYLVEETTPHPIISSSKLFYIYETLRRRVFHDGYASVASIGDSLYVFNHGETRIFTQDRTYHAGKMNIESPVYIQLLRGGKYFFLRNNNKLYVTDDGFVKSKLIYDDRRGIKQSMYWNETTNKLVFSMYTPGTTYCRHYLLQYDPIIEELDTLQTFYTSKEHSENGAEPFCRHIHLLDKDPYTNDLYIGVGDYNGEAGIFRSSNGGHTIEKIGQGPQLWRTLAFYFTKNYIFWTNDSESPQYINRINRSQLMNLPIDSIDVVRFPLFNSAIWCNNVEKDGIYYVGSNSEGQFYDAMHRIYGITFSIEGIPTVYSVICENSLPERNYGIKYHQLFPMAIQTDNLYTYDTQLGLRTFKIKKIND